MIKNKIQCILYTLDKVTKKFNYKWYITYTYLTVKYKFIYTFISSCYFRMLESWNPFPNRMKLSAFLAQVYFVVILPVKWQFEYLSLILRYKKIFSEFIYIYMYVYICRYGLFLYLHTSNQSESKVIVVI